MKTLLVLILTLGSTAYAESILPPVIDYSNYSNKSELSGATNSANFSYGMSERLAQLQHEIQQLRGMVEEQVHALEKLKKRQVNIYSDIDQRFNDLVDSNVQKEAVVLEKSAKESSIIADKAMVVAVKNQQESYQTAYQILKNGYHSEAISAFKLFIIDFPQGEFADNAQYWLAEAYKGNQDFNSAKAAFLKVISDFTGSPKVPDALLKLGYIELEQNNKAKARGYFTQITSGYPKTVAAHLATEKIMQMKPM